MLIGGCKTDLPASQSPSRVTNEYMSVYLGSRLSSSAGRPVKLTPGQIKSKSKSFIFPQPIRYIHTPGLLGDPVLCCCFYRFDFHVNNENSNVHIFITLSKCSRRYGMLILSASNTVVGLFFLTAIVNINPPPPCNVFFVSQGSKNRGLQQGLLS
jgi:hypothetical protein